MKYKPDVVLIPGEGSSWDTKYKESKLLSSWYEIVADGDKVVLMHKKDHPLMLQAESSSALKTYHKGEE